MRSKSSRGCWAAGAEQSPLPPGLLTLAARGGGRFLPLSSIVLPGQRQTTPSVGIWPGRLLERMPRVFDVGPGLLVGSIKEAP